MLCLVIAVIEVSQVLLKCMIILRQLFEGKMEMSYVGNC